MDSSTSLLLYSASNFWIVILLFVVLSAISHLVLINWLKIGKIGWKRIDYIWLAAAALGLLGTTAEVRKFNATNLIESRKISTESAYKSFRSQIEFGTGPAVCGPFIRTEYSPKNFDELQNEYSLACEYNKRILTLIPENISKDYQPIELPAIVIRPQLNDKLITSDFSRVDKYLKDYNESQKELQLLLGSQKRTNAEETAVVFGPFLLAFALALRVVKVRGEILLEKAK